MAPNQPSETAGTGPASTPADGAPPAPVQRPEGYEVQQYESDGWLGGVVDLVQRFGLAQGLTMRPAADIPRTNARSYEHPELKGMVDTATHQQVDELGEMWNGLGNDIMNFGASLHNTATHIDAVWEGEAGLAARNMLVGLAKWSEQTGQGVQYMSTTMRTQGDAAGKAKADMPDPVPYDPAVYQDQINSTNNPFKWIQILGDAREQYDRHNAAREEAIRVTETYSTSLHNTNGTMPAFTPPPEFGDGGGGKRVGGPLRKGEGSGTGGDDPSGPGYPPPYEPDNPPPYNDDPPPYNDDPPPYNDDPPPYNDDPPPYNDDPPPYNDDPPPPRPGYPPGHDLPTPTPGQLAPHVPGIPGGPPGGVGPGGGGGIGVPGFLPAAAGLGGGGFGPTGGAGFGPTRGGESATGAGKGAAGPAGRGGGLGGAFPPMAGAGRGQGEEDIEHKRPSYLIETEDIWGDGRRVAPPVIGEDPPDYYYPKGKR